LGRCAAQGRGVAIELPLPSLALAGVTLCLKLYGGQRA
jgi:hypothetical protein